MSNKSGDNLIRFELETGIKDQAKLLDENWLDTGIKIKVHNPFQFAGAGRGFAIKSLDTCEIVWMGY